MGRGRQKAKHTKVARELKYMSPEMDYRALERELTNGPSVATRESDAIDDEEDDDWSTS